MTENSKGQGFDISKYRIATGVDRRKLVIEETGDKFEVTVKQLSWAKRNQLVSKCLSLGTNGQNNFDGDLYIRECLKQMIVEAPWGVTNETFLASIDSRLGSALETLVPSAFGEESPVATPTDIKKG